MILIINPLRDEETKNYIWNINKILPLETMVYNDSDKLPKGLVKRLIETSFDGFEDLCSTTHLNKINEWKTSEAIKDLESNETSRSNKLKKTIIFNTINYKWITDITEIDSFIEEYNKLKQTI